MNKRTTFGLLCTACLLSAQTRDKRVTPVDSAAKQTFDKQLKVALLVGVGNYREASGLAALKYPATDVATLAAELTKQGYLVRKLTDADATRGVVRRTLNEIASALDRDQGTFLFYFSGHGFEQNGRNYLATFGSTADDLKDEGLLVSDVEAILKASGARQTMMFIDACRNDPAAGAKSVGARTFAALNAAQGLRALYSTRAGRVSYESDDLKQGVFTYFLVRGLRGEAAGADGLVTFRDLTDYLIDHVRAFGVQTGFVQVPYEAGESSGDFLLARSNGLAPAVIAPKPVASTPAPSTAARSPRLIAGSPEGVMSLAWFPDGRRFMAGTNHGGVTIWDSQSERMIVTAAPEMAAVAITHVAVGGDGKHVAASGGAISAIVPSVRWLLRVFDADTGKQWWSNLAYQGLRFDSSGFDSISFSADTHILAAGNPKDGVRGFDAYNGKPLFKLSAVHNAASSLDDLILLFSPNDPRTLYAAGQALMNVDGATGGNFRTVSPEFPGGIGAFDVSPRNPDVIWVASNEGPVHRTMDGGKAWNTVFHTTAGRATWVEASHFDPAVAWLNTASGIYKTTDYGQTWKKIIDADKLSLNVIRENPARRGELIMGSHEGVYIYNEEP